MRSVQSCLLLVALWARATLASLGHPHINAEWQDIQYWGWHLPDGGARIQVNHIPPEYSHYIVYSESINRMMELKPGTILEFTADEVAKRGTKKAMVQRVWAKSKSNRTKSRNRPEAKTETVSDAPF